MTHWHVIKLGGHITKVKLILFDKREKICTFVVIITKTVNPGIGTEKDYDKAFRYFCKGSDLAYAGAQGWLGKQPLILRQLLLFLILQYRLNFLNRLSL